MTRDGTIKAVGTTPDEQGCYSLSVYVKKGKDFEGISTGARIDKDGQLKVYGIRENDYSWVPTPKYRNVSESLRHNTTSHVDRYGNWIFAGEPYRDGIVRKIYYYDDGYDAEEDKWVDEAIAAGVKMSKEARAFKPSMIIVFIVAFAIKAIWLLLMVYLVLLLFKRRWAYGVFNRWAHTHITPSGLFCKAQLHGIIPVVLLFAPSFLMFGKIALRESEANVVTWAWVLVGSLLLCLTWCYAVVCYKSRTMPRHTAAAMVGFGVWSILTLVAVVAIVVVLAWVAIVLLFLGFGLRAAIGGFISGGAAVGAAGGMGLRSSSEAAQSCAMCGRLGDASCPHFKENPSPGFTCGSWMPK